MGNKKGKWICIAIGLIMIAVSILTIFITFNTDHYTAAITEISSTYTTTTHKSGKKDRTYYNEKVTVSFVNGKGEHKEAKELRVKRNSETQLPKVGDTIEVTDNLFGVREFRTLTPLTVAGTLIVVGIIFIITSFKVGKKKTNDTAPE